MKNIILFLTFNILVLSHIQITCEQESIDLDNSLLSEKTEQKSEPKKSFKDYCNEKVKVAKNKFNNSLKWVKNNPKTSFCVAANVILGGIIVYGTIKYKSLNQKNINLISENTKITEKFNNEILDLKNKISALKNEKDNILIKLDNKNYASTQNINTLKSQVDNLQKLLNRSKDQNNQLVMENSELKSKNSSIISGLLNAEENIKKLINENHKLSNFIQGLTSLPPQIRWWFNTETLRDTLEMQHYEFFHR